VTPEIFAFENPDEVYTAVADYVVSGINAFADYVDDIHVALTGGTDGTATSLAILKQLASVPAAKQIHLWWSDERFVPLDDAFRNDGRIADTVAQLGLTSAITVHRAPAPTDYPDVHTAAKAFATDLSAVDFAFAVVGVGPDGHIASLFPGMWNESEARIAFGVDDSPKPPAQRVTFSFATLAAASNIAVVACGETKADVLNAALSPDSDLPIARLAQLEQCSLWLDSAAVSTIRLQHP